MAGGSRSPCSFLLDFDCFRPSLSGIFLSNICKYMHSAGLALFNASLCPVWALKRPSSCICLHIRFKGSTLCLVSLFKTSPDYQVLHVASVERPRWPFRDIPVHGRALLLSYLIKSGYSDTANRNLSAGRELPMKMRVVPQRWLSPRHSFR